MGGAPAEPHQLRQEVIQVSKRLDVVKAVKALAAVANPHQTVKGLEQDARFPDRIPPEGLIIVRNSDPGEPEVDLSPLVYHYEHPIKIEVAASSDEALDAILMRLGTAIEADRHLGGLCSWLEAEAPDIDDLATLSSSAVATELTIFAHYSTTSPLG
jgi:hypothetical protein